jgi:hypothetical protein
MVTVPLHTGCALSCGTLGYQEVRLTQAGMDIICPALE